MANKKFVSVDPGKGDTKVSVFDVDKKKISTYIYNTKYSEGDFCDDALESNTFIAEIEGNTFKVGNGALQSAALEVTKMSDIHRFSTLLALAMVTEPGKTEELDVVLGCPLSEYSVPKKRKEYMDYMLPDGEVSVKLKTKSDKEPEIRKFKISSKKVLPETSGIFFMELESYDGDSVGIIDVGNGTAIGAIYSDYEIDHAYDFTSLQGGGILVSSLSELLTATYSRYNAKYTLKLLTKPTEERKLPLGDPQKETESAKLIHDHIIKHLQEIKQSCNAKQWSLEFMPIIFGGGTSLMLKDEIVEVFGKNTRFSKHGVHANSLGFLRRLVQQKLGIDCISVAEKEKEEKTA